VMVRGAAILNKSLCLLACSWVALSACKEEQVPEHVLQQRRHERELKQRQQEEVKQRAKTKSAAPQLWTVEVRKMMLQVYRARGVKAARSIQALAHLGPSSAAALRHIAGSAAMDRRKQVLASLVLVELQMFHPAQLAELCRAHELPLVQRAAIEALGRLGNPASERLLQELTPLLSRTPPDRAGQTPAGTKRPLRPMAHVLRVAKDRSRKWWYSDQQLVTLDRILQADTPQKLQVAMAAVTDRALDKGLRALLGSPAVRPPVKAAVAHKYVELAQDNPRVLRAHCARGEPALLRMASAGRLLELGGNKDRAFIQKLSAQEGDPLAPVLTRMLTGR